MDKEDGIFMKIMKQKIKLLCPQLIFLIVTFCIFMPSSLFLGNLDEFAVGFTALIPLLMAASLITAAVVILIGLIVPKKICNIYAAVIFGGALAAYVQGNFLNPDFGVLNGRQIQWSQFKVNGIISTVVWIVLIVVPAVIVCFKKDIMTNIIKWGSLFLSSIQVVTLVVLIVSSKRSVDYSYVVTKNDEFALSSQGNVVVFIVDTLDNEDAQNYVIDRYCEELKDFTYFDNMIGGGAPTALGVPLMLTGYQYDTTQSLADYRKKAYEEGSLIQDMSDNGYDVKLYTSSEYLNGVNQEAVANTAGGQKYRISDKVQFFKNIYKMSAFYAFPQIIKQYFWFYGDDFAACQAPKNNNIIQYELDDSQLYADFKNNGGITVDAGNKTFTLYHMVGAHAPYEMNEQCVDVGETETSLDKQIQGVFRYINEYMQQMKDKGVYDNSTVIITADHGGYGLYERPAVFVKMANTHNDVMQVNSDSVTFKNLYATYGEAALGQKSNYGKTLFDMAGVSQSRYHVAPWDVSKGMYPADEYLKNRDYSVFRIEGDAVNPQISVIKDEQQMKNINN